MKFEELAGMIDHSILLPATTDSELKKGCQLAADYQVYSVCVRPAHAAPAKKLLAGTGVRVGTVIAFPHGGSKPHVKAYEIKAALEDGVKEVDLVLNIGALLSGNYSLLELELREAADTAHWGGALLKVILETGYLNRAQKIKACQLARESGADYVKTSTGFGPSGATLADISLMKKTVGPKMGVKAAGGIRTLEETLAMINAGASRIGTSSTKDILDEFKRKSRAI